MLLKKTKYNALKAKVDAIGTSGFVSMTKFTKDTNILDDKIYKVEKKIPDITGLATKSSVTYLITQAEDEIDKIVKKIPDISGLATKTELIAVENKVPNASDFVLKSDYATEISTIKNDYATNASLDSKINDLKAQHITDEVKKVDEKVKKNASDILGFEGRLKQKEYVVDEAQRENSFNGGFYYYYLEESYLVYKCKQYFFRSSSGNRITSWRASGIKNLSTNSDLKAIPKEQGLLPIAEDNGRMNVEFNDNYFVQNKVLHPSNNTGVNIYIVYRFDETSNTRNTDYTIQNALFGAVKITKNAADTSKNKYEGYGVCFDEGGKFSIKDINDARNVIIFGVEMSFSTHATNKANNLRFRQRLCSRNKRNNNICRTNF